MSSSTLRHILLDVGYPMTLVTLSVATQALQNVATLMGHSAEPFSLDSLLSLSTVNSEFQMVMKCVEFKSGFGRIIAALNDVKLKAGICHKPSESEFFDCLRVAYSKVLEDLKIESISEGFWTENPNVEMCIITQKNGSSIRMNLDKLLKTGKLPRLKRNLVIEVTKDSLESSDTGLVELHKIPDSEEGLQNFFKWFLLCSGRPRDLIHIDMPGMTVKCDVVPIMINPVFLPAARQFSLQRLPNCAWHKNDETTHQERRLVVLNRLSSSGLSEAQIFGEPTLIVPSSRDQFIDQDSYAENFQVMKTLGQSLNDNDEWLVTKLNSKPSGFFVLMPGENSFLVKPLLSAELRLPGESSTESVHFENKADLAKLKVARSLACLNVKDELKDEEIASDLYSALMAMKTAKPSKDRTEPFNCWSPAVKTPENEAKRKIKKKVESPVKFYKKFKK